MSLSIEVARRILEASKRRANELRSPVSIAIVDAGGHLVLFERMMSPYGWATASISIAKATTAVMFNQSTDSVAQWGSGIPGFASSMATMSQGKFIMAAGGWPIRVGGATVGGIGVSGGNGPGRDDEIARAGLATLAGMTEAMAPAIPAHPVQDAPQPQRSSSMPLPPLQSQQSQQFQQSPQAQSASMSGRQYNPVAAPHLTPEEDSLYTRDRNSGGLLARSSEPNQLANDASASTASQSGLPAPQAGSQQGVRSAEDDTSSLDSPKENRGGQS